MSRGVTLSKLLTDYRSEARLSGNPANNINVRDSQVRLLQRTQETLWEDHDWPFLRVRRYLSQAAGQRYYDPAGARMTPAAAGTLADDIDINRIERIDLRYNEEWVRLHHGIDNSHYATRDSDLDERETPIERWQYFEDEQIEVWPIPADDFNPTNYEGALRITGIRNLKPLVADDDRADLDDRLIVLFAAAETLAAAGAQDAQLKIENAQTRLRALIGNHSKAKVFSLRGRPSAGGKQLRGPPRVHYRVNET